MHLDAARPHFVRPCPDHALCMMVGVQQGHMLCNSHALCREQLGMKERLPEQSAETPLLGQSIAPLCLAKSA